MFKLDEQNNNTVNQDSFGNRRKWNFQFVWFVNIVLTNWFYNLLFALLVYWRENTVKQKKKQF